MLLISDLHLQPAREDITRSLDHFLREIAPGTARLFILGDLFEVWLGDDAGDELADHVAESLSELRQQGTEIFLMHGNRDFLLGPDYAARCGATLLDEPHLMRVGERNIALLHGDSLCTRDVDYQKFRSLVRNHEWQREFLAQSVESRRDFAQQARAQSREVTSMAAVEIMDVTDAAVVEFMREEEIDTLIHGHTHRPAIHEVAVGNPGEVAVARRRMVLGDWDKRGWYGRIEPDGSVSLHSFDLAA